MPNGNKKMKTVTGKTAKEVKRKLEKIKVELLTDNYIDSSSITIPQLAKAVNDEKHELNITSVSAYTRSQYSIRHIEESELNAIPIQKVTEPKLRSFYADLIKTYSNSTIKKVYAQINIAYKKAVKLNIVKYNINDDIPCPKSDKPTKKIKALTIEQQKKVVEAILTDNKEPYRTMLLLSLFTGMRMGEVCSLYLSDIDFSNSEISIERTLTRGANDTYIIGENAKTEAGTRQIKVIPWMIEELQKYKDNYYTKNADNVFFSINGKLVTVTQANYYYRKLITRYGIDDTAVGYNQHQLRHTYATRCIESGMSAKVLQKKLGHTDIKITMNTYADVFARFEDTEDEKLNRYLMANNLTTTETTKKE